MLARRIASLLLCSWHLLPSLSMRVNLDPLESKRRHGSLVGGTSELEKPPSRSAPESTSQRGKTLSRSAAESVSRHVHVQSQVSKESFIQAASAIESLAAPAKAASALGQLASQTLAGVRSSTTRASISTGLTIASISLFLILLCSMIWILSLKVASTARRARPRACSVFEESKETIERQRRQSKLHYKRVSESSADHFETDKVEVESSAASTKAGESKDCSDADQEDNNESSAASTNVQPDMESSSDDGGPCDRPELVHARTMPPMKIRSWEPIFDDHSDDDDLRSTQDDSDSDSEPKVIGTTRSAPSYLW